ncbi:xanthine dehydrogenase family protein molybdopterin-binding subunit [Dissulfurirhabdus thermomarina]|uniref:Xanthine dehydrogenase family protein molybdopterin-binding subunit n=1 Tax=Dissulfurirhabdus thermomarina TaxID=1765737 RepID=A0A6N9TPW6_DISTH|nr:xanthine dehydrogenase family protein molybdopterin-binding subunit [Dissulfurirhabdus thermomarina]NDY43322.1 xanthine dehydrogenase family protein molybdopterin-binding subunit [Dissulfurirhabdus thermomarina]NMX24282.1 xanthine dehydrogenase family protein molybdopterin-binding subunit [Dissulfurirhabdus thermomarina]
MRRGLTRRRFLQGSAGLVLAAATTPAGCRLFRRGEVPAALSPSVWLRVTPDEAVTVVVAKSEMGQGVTTSLPMLVAEELEADWARVRFEVAPADDRFNDPVWGTQATGGSTSIRHLYEPLRLAGAAAREMLRAAAAREWGVPVARCRARAGVVTEAGGGRRATYGELCRAAAELPVPDAPPLKPDGEFRLLGTEPDRLDLPVKVAGTAVYGMDVFVDGMVYAAVARPPAFGAHPGAFDEAAARRVPGVRHVQVLPGGRGIGVCADTPWAARRGVEALAPSWAGAADPSLDDAALERAFLAHLGRPGVTARDDGDAPGAVAAAERSLRARYLVPYLAHATMEPMNCTARVGPGGCEVWVPTQNQSGARRAAARASGLPLAKVRVHTTYLGGGFGRRFETDVVEEAVALAKGSGRPVKLLWSREDDFRHDFYRPACACDVAGALGPDGRMAAWHHRVAVPSIFARVFPDRVEGGVDPAAVEGLRNLPYEVPNVRVEYVRVETPVPVGFWRSVGSSHNAFAVESFVDEMARAAGQDPLAFRLAHLGGSRRARCVLETAAAAIQWWKGLRPGEGRGIAQHFSFGSYVALAVEVRVDRPRGRIRVLRACCAVDCGRVVHPDTVKAQMEGAVLFGLGAALKEEVHFGGGGVATSNFDDYEPLRMSEAPMVEVHLVESGEAPGGVGEPGVPPVAPAVANAVFDAVGVRLRRLPLSPANVARALSLS